MAFWEELKKGANAVATAATGGAWSLDGKSGYMFGGNGMVDIYDGYAGGDPKSGKNGKIKSAIPGIGDAEAARLQNEKNMKEAQINRNFQERMSSTAYQRAMQDMERAGLNPMLAYQQGGASAPSGAQATINSESKTGLGHFVAQNLMNVNSAKQQQQQINQQSQINDSTIKLQGTAAAKNLQEAEKTRLDNVKQKKYEPLHEKGSQAIRDASKTYDRIIESLSNTAKKVGEFHTPPIVQGRNIKVLGPASKQKFQKQSPN